MKSLNRIGKVILIILAVLVALLIALAYMPVSSKIKTKRITQEEVPALRQKIIANHHIVESYDGTRLFLRHWRPDSLIEDRNTTAILILHGVTAHSGAYDMAAVPMSTHGYHIFGLDYRGHGLSDGPRGDYSNRESWIKDIVSAMSWIKENGYNRLVVMGHSLGIAATIYAASDSPELVDGLILLSGAYKGREGVREEPSYFEMARILASSVIRPDHPVMEYYRDGMTGTGDPLFNFAYTLRFFRMLDMEALRLPSDMDIPILVAIGDQDELFTVESVQELYEDMPGNQAEFKILTGARHAVFPMESWHELADWIDQRSF